MPEAIRGRNFGAVKFAPERNLSARAQTRAVFVLQELA
jgi:hypothetical protein